MLVELLSPKDAGQASRDPYKRGISAYRLLKHEPAVTYLLASTQLLAITNVAPARPPMVMLYPHHSHTHCMQHRPTHHTHH